MCAVNITSSLNSNFVITNIILSMQGEFTCEQVCQKLAAYNYSVPPQKVKNVIKHLRENDYLRESGYLYSVIDAKDSVRWGLC